MLSKITIQKLEANGLKIFGKQRTFVRMCKPIEVSGNCIEGEIFTPIHEIEVVDGKAVSKEKQFETDAPMLSIDIEKNTYRVSVWQWVPGPGPGDFEIDVKLKEEAYAIAINYFFGKNGYFEAFRNRKLMENKQ